jgi:hypothetical protein
VRFLDGLQKLQVAPGDEWAQEFFRVSADKIVRTSERVSRVTWLFSVCPASAAVHFQ